jgi:tRNA(fMet)-specific endonuclease VapC
MYCLDTNAVTVAINMRQPLLRPRLQRTLRAGIVVGVSAIVLFELWFGIENSNRREASAAELAKFLTSGVTPWPFEPDDAKDAGEIRASLRRAGTPVGPYDILIAAQARRRGATLVTSNKREFLQVPGLRIEDWSQSD